jgi:hypothetical protein
LTPGVEALLHPDRFDDLHIALRDAAGRVFAGDLEMPLDARLGTQDGVAIHGGILGEEPVRIATVLVPVEGVPGEGVTVQVAESMARPHALASSLCAESFLPQIVLLGGAFVLVGYGLAYVVTPMNRLKAAIRSARWCSVACATSSGASTHSSSRSS